MRNLINCNVPHVNPPPDEEILTQEAEELALVTVQVIKINFFSFRIFKFQIFDILITAWIKIYFELMFSHKENSAWTNSGIWFRPVSSHLAQ